MVAQNSLANYGCIDDPTAKIRHEANSLSFVDAVENYCPSSGKMNELPDIEGFGWEAAIEERGPAEVIQYWHKSSKGSWDTEFDHEKIPGEGGIIISGAREYLEQNTLTKLPLPNYYSRFDKFDPVHRWSADGLNTVEHRFLRRCVRLANGSGHIDTEETNAVLCAPGTVLVTGPRGVFLVPITDWGRTGSDPSRELPEPPEAVWHTVKGISLPEENRRLRTGFERLIELTTDSPYPSPEAYSKFDCANKTHTVRLADGSNADLNWNDLAILAENQQNVKDVCGQNSHYCNGQQFDVEVSESDLPGKVGEEVTVHSNSDGIGKTEATTGIVIGYQAEWNENRYISVTSSGVRELELLGHIGLIKPSLEIAKKQLTLETVDPTN